MDWMNLTMMLIFLAGLWKRGKKNLKYKNFSRPQMREISSWQSSLGSELSNNLLMSGRSKPFKLLMSTLSYNMSMDIELKTVVKICIFVMIKLLSFTLQLF